MLSNTIFETTLFYMLFFLFVTNGVFGVDADEVKSVSVMEGESVTLHTNLTHIQKDDQILWMFGPQEKRIAETYKQNIDMFSNKIFGDRLKLDSQTGSLTITNMTITDSGLYKLQIISDRGNSNVQSNLTVYARVSVPVIIRDSSQCSSSSERSSVSKCVLLCSVMNVTHVSLSWYKGNSLLSNISVSDLNIRLSLPLEVEYQDNNTYGCVVSNPVSNQTKHLHINELCQPCSGNFSKTNYATIISVLMIVLAAGLLLLCLKCKEASKKGLEACDHAVVQREEEEVQYAETVFCRQNEQKKTANGTDETIYSSVI